MLLISWERINNIERFLGKDRLICFLELVGLNYLEGCVIFEEIGNFVVIDKEW